jgi:hypothetical protein
MKKIIIAAIAFVMVGQAYLFAHNAHALSCLPLDMYLETVLKEEGGETTVFVGTATAVTADHTQVVTVSDAVKGWVAPKVWLTHPYSTDWQYFCSNGPAKAGESTLFFVTIDPYGSFTAVHTLPADSAEAKEFIKDAEAAKIDAGITEATASERANEVSESIKSLLTALVNLFKEFGYWQSESK